MLISDYSHCRVGSDVPPLILPWQGGTPSPRPRAVAPIPTDVRNRAPMTTSSSLWQPFTVGRVELAHRLALAPMTRSRANPDGTPGELAAAYYGQRASLGLIITEGTQPSEDGQGYLNTPGIHTPEHVEGWRKVADAPLRAGQPRPRRAAAHRRPAQRGGPDHPVRRRRDRVHRLPGPGPHLIPCP